MIRARTILSAGSLVASPLLLLAYWLTYPAYGELAGDKVIQAVNREPSMTALSDVFAFLGAFLAVPASLALIRVLRRPTPRLAWVGGSLSVVGWIAVTALLMTDVLAVEIANQGPSGQLVRLFKDLLSNPFVIALNVAASLHIVGGLLIGIALVRSRLIPRWLAIGATVASPVHLGANLAGQLWLDSMTWVVVAAAYAFVVPAILKDEGGKPSRTTGPLKSAARVAAR
jgi:Domain of unknown function (DUF4386)